MTCSVEDESWALPLPPILNGDTQNVVIELKSSSELFFFSVESQTVFISSEALPNLLAGIDCPAGSEVSLEFLLTSDKLGEGAEIFSIPIMSAEEKAAADA